MTTPTLEFASPSSDEEFKDANLQVRLFHKGKKNHFKNNRTATRQQLQDAYDNGVPELEEGSYSKMIKYENTEDWLKPCLLENEEENDKNVVLIMEEKIHAEKPEGIRWLKVVIYDGIEDYYLLRTITNTYDNTKKKRNPHCNKQSKDKNWWICLSTIGTDIEFFNELRRVLELN